MLKRSILVILAIVLALAVASASAQDAVELPQELRLLVQRGLVTLGFDPGPADGLFGPKTRQAIAAWQAAKGFDPATGYLTLEQAAALATIGKEATDKLPELHVGPAKEVPLPAQVTPPLPPASTQQKPKVLISTNPRCTDEVKRKRRKRKRYCWIELSNKPDCFMYVEAASVPLGVMSSKYEVTWDGVCSETDPEVAHGTGTFKWDTGESESEETGEMLYGKKSGHWTESDHWTTSNFRYEYTSEGPYVDGRKHGHWMVSGVSKGDTGRSESQEDGPYVNGMQHGLWRRTTITTYPSGDSIRTSYETPYVDGRKHGEEVIRGEDGTVSRVQWDRGKGYYKGQQIWPPVSR